MDVNDADLRWWQRAELILRRPLVFALGSVALVGLLAVLYLNQVAGVAVANARLRTLNTQQTRLQRQDATLHQQLGAATNPATVDQKARAMGLRPGNPADVLVVAVEGVVARVVGTLSPDAGSGGQP
jgi:hypothetical protein